MSSPKPQVESGVVGFDHVALPMRDSEAMASFYRSLGLSVSENPSVVQVHLGDHMINFHRPELWRGELPLRASGAVPPCGDLCMIWKGSPEELAQTLRGAGAAVVEGPVERVGGRGRPASSTYIRDPDGNLLEFMNYGDNSKEHSHVS